MFGNGLDLMVSEVVFTKCRGGRGGVPPRLVYVFTRILFTLSGVLVIMLLLAVRDGVDSHNSHLTCLPVHLFTALTVFLVGVTRRCRALTFLAKRDNLVGLR